MAQIAGTAAIEAAARANMLDHCERLTGSKQMPAVFYKGRTIPARPFGSIEYMTFDPRVVARWKA